MIESDYQRALLLRVAVAIPDVRFLRRNVGLVRMVDGRMFRAASPGQCDLYAIGRDDARHYEVELKRHGAKLSPEQEQWRSWCAEWGVPHCVLVVGNGEVPTDTIDRWVAILRAFVSG